MRIIRGKYGRRRFDVPRNITARPTTDFARENIFNVLENMRDIEDTDALDLFAGTGAVSFEFLSRGCRSVTCVENAHTQVNFIRSVREKLHDDNLTVVKGDVFKYLQTCRRKFDFIFADPPYEHPRFDDVAAIVLDSQMLRPGTIVVIEHNRDHDYSSHPAFCDHRRYGSVNFSIFRIGGEEAADDEAAGENATSNNPEINS